MKAIKLLQMSVASLSLLITIPTTLKGASTIAISGEPLTSSTGTNDLVLIDTFNSPGNYTTHVTTLSNLANSSTVLQPLKTASNNLYSSIVAATNSITSGIATLNGKGTNTTLTSPTIGWSNTPFAISYATNVTSDSRFDLDQNVNSTTNDFHLQFGNSGDRGFLSINANHSNFGSGAANTHNTEVGLVSPGHVAFVAGIGYGNQAHFQFGNGFSTGAGGNWIYTHYQGPSVATNFHSGAYTFQLFSTNGSAFTYPGFLAQYSSTTSTNNTELDFFPDLFAGNPGGDGSDTWNETFVRSNALRLVFGTTPEMDWPTNANIGGVLSVSNSINANGGMTASNSVVVTDATGAFVANINAALALMWLGQGRDTDFRVLNGGGAGVGNQYFGAYAGGCWMKDGLTTPGFINIGTQATVTNGLLLPNKTTAPFVPIQGAGLWSDGTNLIVTFKNGGGALTTNKVTVTAWP